MEKRFAAVTRDLLRQEAIIKPTFDLDHYSCTDGEYLQFIDWACKHPALVTKKEAHDFFTAQMAGSPLDLVRFSMSLEEDGFWTARWALDATEMTSTP
ncbi:hypothetical protein C0Q70_06802 [Pomacea canaliculata]|uniref:Uncharacterized protein n=1 Tax=Pomacea canaliculata TaxID=400727 RepID=A0A2T7PD98_POMCA|nr:hypothetical protein C0Q70_06802 [Pomacea canaliculata]